MAKVLVVDDDANVRLTLALALRRFGHEVAVAPDADAALEVVMARAFDWVVSDVRMPGMSGVEFAERLGATSNAPGVVLTSAYSDVQVPGSVVAFFQKPVDARLLAELLHTPPHPNGNAQPSRNTPSAPGVNRLGTIAPDNPETAPRQAVPRYADEGRRGSRIEWGIEVLPPSNAPYRAQHNRPQNQPHHQQQGGAALPKPQWQA